MGVVHHANYVSWFEIGRTEWIRNTGIAYSKLERNGLLLPVVDLSIQFRQPARYDDLIAVFTKISDFSAARLQFKYEVRRVEDTLPLQDRISDEKSTGIVPKDVQTELTEAPFGELLASGTTLHMWLNSEWKPTRIDKAAPEMYALLQSKKL